MIPALEGPGGKMSASDENGTVYTTDAPNVVKRKSTSMHFQEVNQTLNNTESWWKS